MSREQPDTGGGLSLQTLLTSAAAAVAAAVIVPMIWEKGTLIATALTPIVVAVVSEALRKPAEKISAVAPKVTRRTATGAALRRFEPRAADTRHPERVGARGTGPERFDPLPPEERGRRGGVSADDPYGLRAPDRPRRPWWRIGLVTGALAFVIGAGVVTASELTLFGGSVSDGDRATSLFGGSDTAKESKETKRPAKEEAQPAATPEGTPAPKLTPEPTATPTPTATPSPTPTPSASDATPTPTP